MQAAMFEENSRQLRQIRAKGTQEAGFEASYCLNMDRPTRWMREFVPRHDRESPDGRRNH